MGVRSPKGAMKRPHRITLKNDTILCFIGLDDLKIALYRNPLFIYWNIFCCSTPHAFNLLNTTSTLHDQRRGFYTQITQKKGGLKKQTMSTPQGSHGKPLQGGVQHSQARVVQGRRSGLSLSLKHAAAASSTSPPMPTIAPPPSRKGKRMSLREGLRWCAPWGVVIGVILLCPTAPDEVLAWREEAVAAVKEEVYWMGEASEEARSALATCQAAVGVEDARITAELRAGFAALYTALATEGAAGREVRETSAPASIFLANLSSVASRAAILSSPHVALRQYRGPLGGNIFHYVVQNNITSEDVLRHLNRLAGPTLLNQPDHSGCTPWAVAVRLGRTEMHTWMQNQTGLLQYKPCADGSWWYGGGARGMHSVGLLRDELFNDRLYHRLARWDRRTAECRSIVGTSNVTARGLLLASYWEHAVNDIAAICRLGSVPIDPYDMDAVRLALLSFGPIGETQQKAEARVTSWVISES